MNKWIGFFVALTLCAPVWSGETSTEDAAATLPQALDLDAAKRIALRDNPSLKAAEERANQAKARIAQARSEYFPRIDLSVSGSNTWLSENDYRAARNAALAAPFERFRSSIASSLVGGYTVPGLFSAASIGQSVYQGLSARAAVDNSADAYGAELTATWTLFDGFAREFSLAAARLGRKESEAALLEARRLLMDAVAAAYYDVQLAGENIAIALADEAFNARQLEEAQARRRVGTGSLSDVLNFEVRLNATREELIRARRLQATSRITLATLMGITAGRLPDDVTVPSLPDEPADEAAIRDANELVAYALDHRPDVNQARLSVKRQEANTGAQRAVRYPSVNAVVTHSAGSDAIDWSDDDYGTTVGLTARYNLFAGGRNRARIHEAKAQTREAEWGVTELENAIAAEVNAALETLNAAQESLHLQLANAENVRRNRDLVEKEYQAGQASLVRLNEAQRDLTAAKASLALARVSVYRALHGLQTATAETLANEEPK